MIEPDIKPAVTKKVFVCKICGMENTNPGAHSLRHKRTPRVHQKRAGVKTQQGRLSGYDAI